MPHLPVLAFEQVALLGALAAEAPPESPGDGRQL